MNQVGISTIWIYRNVCHWFDPSIVHQIRKYQIRMLITPAAINSTSATQSIITTLLISELSPSTDQVNIKNETTLINPIAIANGW